MKKKSLYGLKQSPRQWYKKFTSFMVEHGYDKTTSDHCMFIKRFHDGNFIILLLYMDDMLNVGHDAKKIQSLKGELSKYFTMKNLKLEKKIIYMMTKYDKKNGKLWLSQERYVQNIFKRFNKTSLNLLVLHLQATLS
jgi:ATP-binding cassette subfamily B (MDR/TAP) protein 1